jgi:uncharacterized protein YbjT (DUF2867 family)
MPLRRRRVDRWLIRLASIIPDPQLTDALAQVTDPVDIVFCCLGTTRREAGSKEAFIHADYTLVVDTALTGRRLGHSICWW